MVRATTWDGVVPVDQVLTGARPAWGEDWPCALGSLQESPGDWATVTALAGELTGTGLFDRPVTVEFTDPDDFDAEVRCGSRPVLPRVADGMHRVTAAVLAGVRWIRVAPRAAATGDPELVRVRVRLDGPAEPGHVLDFVTSWLRSFRLTCTVWVQSDGAVLHGGACELVYYCPHALPGELAAALVRRAGEHGAGAQVLEVVPTRWAELLAEP